VAPTPTTAALVVCPLEIERRAMRRALARSGDGVEVVRCGPGADAVRAWSDALGPTERAVVLAGLAGALTDARPVGSACVVAEVCDTDGVTRRPVLGAAAPSGAVVTSSPVLVTTAAERASLAGRTGADLVDQESVAFADAATRHGWTWAIARGVSDGPHHPLPPAAATWIDERGRAIPRRVLASLAREPALATTLRRLRHDTRTALQALAPIVAELLAELDAH
jgi:nucleoside phosphorylase